MARLPLFFLILILGRYDCAAAARSFNISDDRLQRDGAPINLRSGSFHYARSPPALWKDRLLRLKAMGLNTVQTYVPWNFHESSPGQFDFTSPDRDLGAFIDLAQGLDLLVMVRLGPYICGEWEFGGFPAWLLNHGQPHNPVTLRTYEPGYISLVERYWAQLLPKVLKSRLYSSGGAVIMVQVENEFGSFGNVATNPNDLKYMNHLVGLVHEHLGQGTVIV